MGIHSQEARGQQNSVLRNHMRGGWQDGGWGVWEWVAVCGSTHICL